VRKSYGWEETIERGKAEKMGKSVGWYIRDGGRTGKKGRRILEGRTHDKEYSNWKT
jgi:hypothetical protein